MPTNVPGKASRGFAEMFILLVICSMFLIPRPTHASAPGSKIEFVAVSDADVERFGTFPFDRKILAQVVHRIRGAEASAIILKFFFTEDQASNSLLAHEARQIPTYFQMGLKDIRERSSDGRLEGTAELPNKTLMPSAAGIGYVNERASLGDRVELEAYADGARVKSLSLIGAELASGHRAEIANGNMLLADRTFPVDKKGRAFCKYAETSTPAPISFSDILDASAPLTARLRGKVIVIGYLAKDTPRISIGPSQDIPIHEAYVRQIACLSHSAEKD